MSKRGAHRKSKLDRLRAVPWIAIAQAGVVVGRRWRGLSAKERAHLGALVRASGGRPANLSAKERAELHGLIGKLDLKGAGRELFGLARPRRRRRGRSRACK